MIIVWVIHHSKLDCRIQRNAVGSVVGIFDRHNLGVLDKVDVVGVTGGDGES